MHLLANQPINSYQKCKPILKWAGGKTQILTHLIRKVPENYGKYIEPFFGGGALYFALSPEKAIIADSNPELINFYKIVAKDVDSLIDELDGYVNDKDFFYEMRAKDTNRLSKVEAAARTLYLNRTAFNGLYRVNKKGQFNVPFGAYKNPTIVNSQQLLLASRLLKEATIVSGDYKDVIATYAEERDFIFLDPPYLPVSEYSDFKRYTKEQFYEEDQVELSLLVKKLNDKGCHILLTNSNHPLIHDLYSNYSIEVHQTKRNISSKGNKRKGEDVIVSAIPKQLKMTNFEVVPDALDKQILKFPSTRYMGSKNKLLPYIRDITKQFKYETALDLFSGSCVVSYLFKAEGKTVISSDYMALSSTISKALIENNRETLPISTAINLLKESPYSDLFVQRNFKDLYFTDDENVLIDNIRANIKRLRNPYRKAIALASLIRACTKKRPRGVFTYTGHRYDDGRKDLRISLENHFLNAVEIFNNAVFDNCKDNLSMRKDAMNSTTAVDLVYMDPPYYSLHSDNEYVRRYHFVEGIACDWKEVEMQWHTKTKKFKNYPTPFSNRTGARDAFDKLFMKYKNSIVIVSYSSNCLPSLDDMVSMLSKYKNTVEVLSLDYRYSFANQNEKISNNRNKVQEYLFVGY